MSKASIMARARAHNISLHTIISPVSLMSQSASRTVRKEGAKYVLEASGGVPSNIWHREAKSPVNTGHS